MAACTLLVALLPSPGASQTLVRTCLPGEARSQGLAARVDAGGDLHLSRVDRVLGDVLHTVVAPDGVVTDTVVAPAASRLAIDEITSTGLALVGDEPVICFRNPRTPALTVAWRAGGVFRTTRIAAGAEAGRDCAVLAAGAGVRVFWREAGRLRTTDLGAAGGVPLAPVDLDAPPGLEVGRDLAVLDDGAGRFYVAHHDGQGALRLTWSSPAGVRTEVVHGGVPAAGVRPALVFDGDGRLVIAHGGLTPRLDAESDAGLYETVGLPGGPFETAAVAGGVPFGGGGQAALHTAAGRALFARERQRSALFGSYDALWFFVDAGAGLTARSPLEQATPASSRHDYGPLAAAVDPFGEPVLVYGDSRSATIVSPSTAPTCLYRRPDADADALPDTVEAVLGTDPQRADTDGDGTSDGEEVLRLGTDPTADDTCTPAPEICDAVDNDCDGETDEALDEACYPGPPGTAGIGLCEPGRRTCAAGRFGSCQGATVPAATDARCDGLDEDCDGATDEDFTAQPTACGVGACGATGVLACVSGAVQDTCRPAAPRPNDATCDGVDDDCDGAVDDDFSPLPTDCGQGVCAASGQLLCRAGEVSDTCRPGRPHAADDATCDGVDDDCDGAVDEDFSPTPTVCGAGACAATGARVCDGGVVRDTCRAGGGGVGDATCDGVDDDCDGAVDEDAVDRPTTCGLGACTRAGWLRCVGGETRSECTAGVPTGVADGCDGIDDDCDGAVDEDALPRPASCGLGACRSAGEQRCVDGRLETVCAPGLPPAADDAACDGVDGDCDGRIDEDAVPREVACGAGVCRRAGLSTCEAGVERIICEPGAPASGTDEACDGLDEDCDGLVDEDFVGVGQSCGEGVCRVDAVARCVDGRIEAGCTPSSPAPEALDDDCNGRDDDCDGAVDEAFFPGPTSCGRGACASTGERACVGDEAFDTCVPGPAAADDARCDGIDDDCDGATDEDFVATPTLCGRGVCASVGRLRCEGGEVRDGCVPTAPTSADDSTCDGLDDDCDGAVDEDADPTPTTCGVGACGAAGLRRCVAGVWVDTCVPTAPTAVSDRTCDGIDDDCDGTADEDHRGALTTCGLGDCAARGRVRCIAGVPVDDCSPGRPRVPVDAVCDGRDNDCDGAVDEDVAPVPTTCGLGVCAALGAARCVDGVREDDCRPGAPLADDDVTCDGLDDDCDGAVDEAFVGAVESCGAGACAREAPVVCLDGEPRSGCVPSPPAADDSTCDGVDDDCDGEVDEDVPSPPIACGTGVCAATGTRICRSGRVVDDCVPGPASGDDTDCDGLDDDCDGETDEGYLPLETRCGDGVCAQTGVRLCLAGSAVDTCRPATPDPDERDEDCDGLDDDCDGTADEAFEGAIETCGTGACRAQGALRCIDARVVSTCRPGTPDETDDACDGVDGDCDGAIDEDVRPKPVVCAPGGCLTVGRSTCVDGVPGDDCSTPPLADEDITCDGVDDDCDGAIDEEVIPEPVACGAGACAAEGARRCVGGTWQVDCVPGAPADRDPTCDGVDDDCDGAEDEDAAPVAVTCGLGVCARPGRSVCVDGRRVERCEAGGVAPAPSDETCDGLDDDCDGLVDEDAGAVPIPCGRGACAALGVRTCGAEGWVDDCQPRDPVAANDATCDGLDDDCDGAVDEDVAERPATCGLGACRRPGVARCLDGRLVDDCTPAAPESRADATCDGVDEDCDGRLDEDVPPEPVTCGLGACLRDGERRCEAGRFVDRCVAGRAAPDDATCNGSDDDCDGAVDEDAAPVPSACGVGVCAATGERSCQGGRIVDSCRPRASTGPDDDCDGLDQDCDGRPDDGFAGAPVLCGEGLCGRIGRMACEAGVVVEQCVPGQPGPHDATCDAVDDDCDGLLDEDAPRGESTCGLGLCAGAGVTLCVDGAWVDTCMPAAPRAPTDETCDAVDDDCDGLVDEDCAPEGVDGSVPPLGDATSDLGVPPGVDAVPTDDASPPDAARDAMRPQAEDLGRPAPDVAVTRADATGPDADRTDSTTTGSDTGTDTLPTLPDAAFEPWPEASVTIETSSPGARVSCDCRAAGPASGWTAALLLILPWLRPRRRPRGPGADPV
jgi:hypothetical protein